MKTSLSIVLPIYNGNCTEIVGRLHEQAEALAPQGLSYEIIVADDGSTDENLIQANRSINALNNCRYVERGFNAGRAAIRNYLACEAKHDWLLYLDADMLILKPDFLERYLKRPDEEEVVDGGVYTEPDLWKTMSVNLRCLYESNASRHFSAEQRQRNPYHDFHTANFLIRREVMLSHPFDERFRRYGYEDVLLGKQLKQSGIAIAHIDNPAGFASFEGNESFVAKTEEGLRTLYQFRRELRGYSRLLTFVDGIHLGAVRTCLRLWHRLFGRLERALLCSRHPNLKVFKLYKIGYYLNLSEND